LLLPVPCSTSLAVPGSVSHSPASPAHHVVGHVGLVLALPRLVVGGPAVGALGHPVLPQGAVQQGQLPQLHLPQLVAALRHLHALLDHLPDSPDCLVHGVCIRSGDVRVQGLVFPRKRLTVLPTNLALLNAALPSNDDLGPRLLLHVLQCVPSRTNEQTHKVDVWMFFLRDHYFVRHLHCWGLVIGRSLVVRIYQHHLLDALMSGVLEFFPLAILSRVQPLSVPTVYWLWARRPIVLVGWDAQVTRSKLPGALLNLEL